MDGLRPAGETSRGPLPGAAAARFAPPALHAFVVGALVQSGARTDDAHLVADGLVAADLRGVHTHGVVRTGVYVARLRRGSYDPHASLTPLRDRGPVVLVDAGAGLGIAMATRAMDLAAERAGLHGVGIVGVRNSSHCGMLAHLALRAVRQEMIGIVVSNADAQVAPWGARAKFLGTNPLAIAVPAGEEPPLVLDMATSVVPHSRVQAAAARGEAIPEGWALDRHGRPTSDPAEALRGALLPFGGPKGSGISLMIDVLAGLLVGALSGPEIPPLYERLDEAQRLGHLLMALPVESFGPADAFARRVDALIRQVRALPLAEGHERVYLPGEIEHERMVDYSARGIPLPPEVRAEIGRLAADLGLPAPEAMG
ncbi:MAG: Ldh family oxidoreductase [Armatimonadota bacterium]|nr:Ldh family oxidoreductase [Armatimonadota bacterium]